jgi:hypothetical protein
MTSLRRIAPVPLAIAMALAAVSPVHADAAGARPTVCPGMIYNGCFYPGPAFTGTEHREIISSTGCWEIPASQSYTTTVSRITTLHAGDDCTGQSHVIYPGLDWKPVIGFTVRSYYYPPE